MTAVAAWTVRNTRIGDRNPFQELTLLVSCNFFQIYGLDHLERGRAFRADECDEPGVPAAVISDTFWKRYFDANPDILEKQVVINGEPFAIVGVTPPDFSGQLRGEGVWIPYSWEPLTTHGRASAFNDPGTAWLWVDGRVKPGVSTPEVVAELNVLLRQQDTLIPGRTTAITVNNGAMIHEPAVRPVAMFVLPLVLGSVALVLLIACANVTLLLLSRAIARQREIAIRLAIGCGRGRLTRMLLTESLLLAALGIPLSLWLASEAPGVMRRMFPLMPIYPMKPDAAVLSYLLAASLAAGIGAGLAPALETLRQRLTPMLAGQDPFAASGGRSRVRDLLITAQIGMSVVLVAATVVFFRAGAAFAARDPSVDAAHVMMAPYEPPRGASPAFLAALTGRLQQLSGVRSIGYAASAGDEVTPPLLVVQGRPLESGRRTPITLVSASYFETMRRPMLLGRGLAAIDAASAVRPLVISDALARIWWPDGGAIGARVQTEDGRAFEIAGVVHADVPFAAGSADTIAAYTLPPAPPPFGTLFIRFDGDAKALQAAIHDVLREMSPTAATMPITLAASDKEQASKFFVMVKMVGTLGLSAIVLALVGVYGVVAFAMSRRTREIGVRMALGASRGDIVRLVLSSGAPPIVAGIGAGLVLIVPAAIGLTRVFRYTPVSLHADDPIPYLLVAISFAAIAVLTMLGPARRASAVQPSVALRTE
jgi:putative ABC transport system permease protein